jgi:hypothetical protein
MHVATAQFDLPEAGDSGERRRQGNPRRDASGGVRPTLPERAT